MTDDHTALLAAVCGANDRGLDWLTVVDADTPRLALADWLDDHGGRTGAIHARFVRRQVAGDTPLPNVPLTVLLGLEPFLTCQPHFYSFNTSPAKHTAVVAYRDGRRFTFRRGFVAEVELSAADWVAHGDALSWHPSESRPCPPTACPGLTVRLTDFPTYQWQLANTPPGWPLHTRPMGRRYVALDCLEHRWPGVRAWHLPEPRGLARWRQENDHSDAAWGSVAVALRDADEEGL